MHSFCDLVAACGPAHTRALRLEESSALQALAGQINSVLEAPQYGAVSAGAKVQSLPSLLQRRVLPSLLRAHSTKALELYEEQRDALSFHVGHTERDAVAAARLDYLSSP